MKTKWDIQDEQYMFPYHYIPLLTDNSFISNRTLSWGGEYLAYLLYVRDYIMKCNPKSLLDVGCGDGRFLTMFNDKDIHLCGIDLSERSIGLACIMTGKTHYMVCDIADINNRFDCVSLTEVIEHIPDEEVVGFVKNCSAALNDNGILVLTVPTKNVPLNEKHYRHYDEKMIYKLSLDANLKIDCMKYICPKKNCFDQIVQRIMNNKFVSVRGYNRFVWKRLWRNGLEAKSTEGEHLFVAMRKRV